MSHSENPLPQHGLGYSPACRHIGYGASLTQLPDDLAVGGTVSGLVPSLRVQAKPATKAESRIRELTTPCHPRM